MHTQDVAAVGPRRQSFATFTPQRMRTPRNAFLFSSLSASLRHGYSQDTSYPPKGQAGQTCSVINEKKIRRDRCQRASKPCLQLALLPSSRHAQKNQLKNSWSLTRSRSRPSQLTLVSTNNSDWGPRCAASDYRADAKARATLHGIGKSFDILEISPNLAFNRSTLNEGGPNECVSSLRVCQQSSLLRPVRHLHQNPSKVSRDTTNSAITSVTSSREQTHVSRQMTKSPVSCQMDQSRHQASNARRLADEIRVMMTAAPLVADVQQGHRGHPDDLEGSAHLENRWSLIAQGSSCSFASEGLV